MDSSVPMEPRSAP